MILHTLLTLYYSYCTPIRENTPNTAHPPGRMHLTLHTHQGVHTSYSDSLSVCRVTTALCQLSSPKKCVQQQSPLDHVRARDEGEGDTC